VRRPIRGEWDTAGARDLLAHAPQNHTVGLGFDRYKYVHILFLFLLSGVSAPAHAHSAPVDELGCHADTVTGGYHCVTGPLSGLEFISKADAQEAAERLKKSRKKKKARSTAAEELDEEDDFQITTRPTETVTGEGASPVSETLTILSWKARKGASRVDVDRVASVMATADITVLQNVEFNERGETAITVVAGIVERRLNEKVCRGWFKSSKGARNGFAFLWRERSLALVDSDGVMHDTCTARPFVIRAETKSSGFATFYAKGANKLFLLTSVDLDKTPKARDVSEMFRAYRDTGWPVIFAGDLKSPAKSPVFQDARRWNFKPALAAPTKTTRSLENVWYKNVTLLAAEPVNLREQFPELSAADIQNVVADRAPIRVDFTFNERDAEALQMQMISKKKGKSPASVEPPIVLKGPSYPAPVTKSQLSAIRENLDEEEAQLSASKLARSKPKKKKNKK